jgi:hypothetical protein
VASKPTQDIILAKVAARLGHEHGPGVVPVPSRTRARTLLREISKAAAHPGVHQGGGRGGGAVRVRAPAAPPHPGLLNYPKAPVGGWR